MPVATRHGWTPATAPGPSGGEMLRRAASIRRDPLSFLQWAADRYGDVVQFPIPLPPTYLVTHPDGVRQVLQTNHRAYGKATLQYRNLALVTGDGLLAADSEQWRPQRRAVQPAFHGGAVRDVVRHSVDAASRRAQRWAERGPGVVDIEHDMMATALEIVGSTLFGADLQGESAELVSATQQALEQVVRRSRNPLAAPLRLPTPANLTLQRAVGRLDELVTALVAARRRDAGDRSPDMLDVLLASDELDEQGVRDQIVTFVVAGHETVASSLTWTWHLLATQPWVADEIAAEADEVYGDGAPGFDDVPKLRWAMATSDESLRLYPPGWLISRTSVEPDEILGHYLPAGSLVLISPYLVHRHPAAGERGEEFDPTRFLAGTPSPVLGTYIPFGAGPRLCIGRDMARAEAAVVVSMLARRFRLEHAGSADVRKNPMVMLKPAGGLSMRITERS